MQVETLKRWLKHVLLLAVLLHLVGCTGDNLEKMIPADATGVVCIDVPDILDNAGMLDGNKVVLPQTLKQAIDDNDTSPLCVLLADLPQLGIDTDSKAYAYFTAKTFGRVILAQLDDAGKARKTLEIRVGGDFE